jgi:hypothetical protein
MDSDFWKPAFGAVVGFVLAQSLNIGKIAWDEWRRPKLRIVRTKNDTLLWQNSNGVGEAWFGFKVRNIGRRVATSVRCQIVKIEFLDKGADQFGIYSTAALDLFGYTGQHKEPNVKEATIVPATEIDILLAYYDSAQDELAPKVDRLLDYFDEQTIEAVQYRFTVVAFDSSNRYVREVITIVPGRKR